MKKWLFCIALLLFSPLAFAASEDEKLNDPRSVLDRPDYDDNNPPHRRAKSGMAWGFNFARHGFPTQDALGDLYQLFLEWVIPWDKMGVFSVGVNGGVLSIYAPETTIPYPNLGNPLVGGQITYQLKFLQNQWIVPAATFFVDYYRIKLNSSGDLYASGAATGFSGKLMINLGNFDSLTARDSYDTVGLTKAYLSLGLDQMTLSNSFLSLSGSFWTMGFRLEYQ